ncbi:MAG: hypothetical protein HQL74_09915 [Magnetococcales bacterium]|nr:hypothetical protein [Magnetococcales bacterium]
MSDLYTKVIGCFASMGTEVICTEGLACIVSGSQDAMERYLVEMGQDVSRHTIKKTRFGEIMHGMRLGAAYAFDKESYERFYPLALAEGLKVSDPTAFQNMPPGFRFFTVQVLERTFPIHQQH